MQAQKNSLAMHSQPQTSEQPVSSSESIRQFLVKAAEVYGKQITAPLVSIWIEALEPYPLETLAPLFRKVLATCKFFPTPAEVLEPIRKAEETAAPEAAEEAWQQVLEIRRVHWNPDLHRRDTNVPTPLERATAALSERVQQAARAAAVWRDFDSVADPHTWAKKRFVESFIAWGELEQDKFLLRDGDIKNLLAGVAKLKALPAPSHDWSELHARGLEYAKTPNVRAGSTEIASTAPIRETPSVVDVEGRAAEIERQKRLILQKHPNLGNMKGIPPELRPAEMEAVR